MSDEVLRNGLVAAPRAWDFLSVALAAVTADFANPRGASPDGWTREFELSVAVTDEEFWSTQVADLERALRFLTTDRWILRFVSGGTSPIPRRAALPPEDSVVLLSGGLDSLIGAMDISAAGRKLLAVSQTVRGDAEKQVHFAGAIGGGLAHLQLNHNATPPRTVENSQRSRSLVFLALGALAATSVGRYHAGHAVPLYLCENGFIAINPPLTGARIGSLSTRTAHPVFLKYVRRVFEAAGIRVPLINPYELCTKGEMLVSGLDQTLLRELAPMSTSCGRFQRYNYKHCGRCVPCQIRRAAFLRWGVSDSTEYVYGPLGRQDRDHGAFDDVRSARMAIAEVENGRFDRWLGAALDSTEVGNVVALGEMVRRGIDELAELHRALGVK